MPARYKVFVIEVFRCLWQFCRFQRDWRAIHDFPIDHKCHGSSIWSRGFIRRRCFMKIVTSGCDSARSSTSIEYRRKIKIGRPAGRGHYFGKLVTYRRNEATNNDRSSSLNATIPWKPYETDTEQPRCMCGSVSPVFRCPARALLPCT